MAVYVVYPALKIASEYLELAITDCRMPMPLDFMEFVNDKLKGKPPHVPLDSKGETDTLGIREGGYLAICLIGFG